MDTIPLRDAIQALRGEILTARGEAPTQGVRFELGPIEIRSWREEKLGARPSLAFTFSLSRRPLAAAARAQMNEHIRSSLFSIPSWSTRQAGGQKLTSQGKASPRKISRQNTRWSGTEIARTI